MPSKSSLVRFFRRLLPGTLAAAIVSAIPIIEGGLQPLEYVAYNLQFQLRGPQSWSDRIAVIEIDERTLRTLGRFPLDRIHYVHLLETLIDIHTAALIFDIAFVESDPADPRLGDLMQQHGRVVLAQATDYQGGFLAPPSDLTDSIAAYGDITKLQDIDGITRRVALSAALSPNPASPGDFLPTLAWATLELHGLFEEPLVELPDLSKELWLNWPGPIAPLRPEDLTRPPSERLPLPLLSVSLIDVLEGHIPAETFTDRFVLIGVTARGLDPLQTPYNQKPETSGIFMHAATFNTLLQDNGLQSPPWWMQGIFALTTGPLFGVAIASQTFSRRIAWAIVAGGGMAVGDRAGVPDAQPMVTSYLASGDCGTDSSANRTGGQTGN